MTAEATCPVCQERLLFDRDNGSAQPPWPQDWYCYVVHDHSSMGEDTTSGEGEPSPQGIWRLVVFYRRKGGRWPEGAKVIVGLQKEQRKELKQAKKIKKDSTGARDHIVR